MKKTLYIALTLLICTGFWFLYVQKKPEQKTDTVQSLMEDTEYREAIALYNAGNYTGADELFTKLETDASMNNLAHLKLKKLQIALAQQDYKRAVGDLELILNNPRFPNAIKSRAIENVFGYFLSTGRNVEFYNTIFNSPSFRELQADVMTKSLYNYAEYGYGLYPTTVLGANTLYGKLEELSGSLSEVDKINLEEFIKKLFTESDKELEHLSLLENQELTKINIYTERARVLNKTTKAGLAVPNSLKIEDQLFKAMVESQKLGNQFYVFSTTYNYIDHLVGLGTEIKPARQEAKNLISNQEVFNPDKIMLSEYKLVIKTSKGWSQERVRALQEINPNLGKLIEKYK